MDELQKAQGLVKQAGDLYVKQNYHAAIRKARQALKVLPGNSMAIQMMAIQMIAVSSCYLKNRKDVMWAFKRLSPKKRSLVRRVCQRNGVQID